MNPFELRNRHARSAHCTFYIFFEQIYKLDVICKIDGVEMAMFKKRMQNQKKNFS